MTALSAGSSSAGRTLLAPVSALETSPVATSEMQLAYNKRLMLCSGRANPELAARIASKLGVELSKLSADQAAYLGIPVEGPFKPENYRY